MSNPTDTDKATPIAIAPVTQAELDALRPSPSLTQILPRSSIVVVDREREDLGDIEGLMESIVTFGQLMPVLVRKSDMRLIDGGRRFEALTRLESDNIIVMFREDVTDEDLKMMEVEANEQRKEFTWKEKVRAIRKVHKLRGRTAAARSESWTLFMTGRLLNVQVAQVQYALVVAEALDDPNHPAQKAGSVNEALQVLAKQREDIISAALAKSTAVAGGATISPTHAQLRQQSRELDTPDDEEDTVGQPVSAPDVDDLGSDPTPDAAEPQMPAERTASILEAVNPSTPETIRVELSQMFFNMKAEDFLPMLRAESVDHFVTDPPYGIDMSNLNQGNTGMDDIERVEENHQVKDNLRLIEWFITESFRILKPGGWLVMWYDLDHHEKIQNWGKKAGYSVMRWPFEWIKTHPCLNQQASKNFTKSTEYAMFMRKGNATLVSQQPTNYHQADGRIDRARYKNPFAKPYEIWQRILTAIAIRGQTICDPFAGERSCPLACIQLGLRPLACEELEHHHNAGDDHTRRLYENLLGGPSKVQFI